MDEEQQKSAETDSTHEQPKVTIPAGEYTPAPPPQGIVVGPYKSRKKQYIILSLLLLVAAAAAVYFFVLKKDKPVPTQQATTATQNPEPQASEITGRLNFQIKTKLLSYDTMTQKTEVITSSLPEEANVVDFYQNSATWRAYYITQKSNESIAHFWFIEKDKQPVEMGTGDFSGAVGNAKARVLAYTSVYSTEPNATADQKLTRSYVIKDGKTEEVLRSNDGGSKVMGASLNDPKDPRFHVTGVSADGTKLLFTRYNCVYCDGGSSPTSFEMNLSDKKTTPVLSSSLFGGAFYDADGKSILTTESDDSPLGGPGTGPADLKITRFAAAGGAGTVILNASSTKWGYVSTALDGSAFYTLNRSAENPALEGFYAVTGPALNQNKKLTVSGLPANFIPQRVGIKVNDCFGLVLNNSVEPSRQSMQIGTLCTKADGSGVYTKLDETSWNSTGQYPAVSILR